MAGLLYSSKGRKFTKQYELLSIEGLRSKVALQNLFQFPGTHCTHIHSGKHIRAAARYRNGNGRQFGGCFSGFHSSNGTGRVTGRRYGRNDGWLIHFAISPQFNRYTGEFRLGFPLSYGLPPISASLRRLPGNNHLKLVTKEIFCLFITNSTSMQTREVFNGGAW
jgi:hypothetical protein